MSRCSILPKFRYLLFLLGYWIVALFCGANLFKRLSILLIFSMFLFRSNSDEGELVTRHYGKDTANLFARCEISDTFHRIHNWRTISDFHEAFQVSVSPRNTSRTIVYQKNWVTLNIMMAHGVRARQSLRSTSRCLRHLKAWFSIRMQFQATFHSSAMHSDFVSNNSSLYIAYVRAVVCPLSNKRPFVASIPSRPTNWSNDSRYNDVLSDASWCAWRLCRTIFKSPSLRWPGIVASFWERPVKYEINLINFKKYVVIKDAARWRQTQN